jgi:hypothetical protein
MDNDCNVKSKDNGTLRAVLFFNLIDEITLDDLRRSFTCWTSESLCDNKQKGLANQSLGQWLKNLQIKIVEQGNCWDNKQKGLAN